MAEREEEADRQRRPPILQQLADGVVDSRDVVGVDRMPETEHPGKKGGAEQGRAIGEQGPRPGPGGGVGDAEQGVKTNERSSAAAGTPRGRSSGSIWHGVQTLSPNIITLTQSAPGDPIEIPVKIPEQLAAGRPGTRLGGARSLGAWLSPRNKQPNERRDKRRMDDGENRRPVRKVGA